MLEKPLTLRQNYVSGLFSLLLLAGARGKIAFVRDAFVSCGPSLIGGF